MDALHGEFRRKSGAVVFSFTAVNRKKLEVWNSRHSESQSASFGCARWRAPPCVQRQLGRAWFSPQRKYACAYRAAVLDVEVVQKIGVERLLELPVLDAIPDQCCRRGRHCRNGRGNMPFAQDARQPPADGAQHALCEAAENLCACAGQRQAVALLARGGRTAPAAAAQGASVSTYGA